MIYRKIIIPGNEVRPGIWEGEVSAEETDCDHLEIIICQHDHAFQKNHGGTARWICQDCGGYKNNIGVWIK